MEDNDTNNGQNDTERRYQQKRETEERIADDLHQRDMAFCNKLRWLV